MLFHDHCTGCQLCSIACEGVAEAIAMVKVPEEQKQNKKSIMPQIDYGKCVFCGLCVDACPFYALYMTNDYELSSFTKEGLIYTPAQLAVKPYVEQDSEIVITKNGEQLMADAAFLALTVITIGSAIAALEMRSLIYGSIALMGTLGGIAGFFFILDAPFVALFQLAVYVGSIAVLILFTVMLVKRELIFKKIEDRRRKFAGIGLMLIIMVSLGAVFLDSGIKTITTDEPTVDFRDIGADFVIYYWPALILMGLILAGSVTGALILARREDVENDQRIS